MLLAKACEVHLKLGVEVQVVLAVVHAAAHINPPVTDRGEGEGLPVLADGKRRVPAVHPGGVGQPPVQLLGLGVLRQRARMDGIALPDQLNLAHRGVFLDDLRFNLRVFAFGHRQQLAGEHPPRIVLIRCIIRGIAIVQPQQNPLADGNLHQVVGVLHQVAVLVHCRYLYKGGVALALIRQMQLLRFAKAVAEGLCHQLARFIIGIRAQHALFIRQLPIAGDFTPHLLHAYEAVVDKEGHRVLVAGDARVNQLPGRKIPIREKMDHRFLCPRALELIKCVLFKAGGVHHAKVGVLGVVGGGLAQVILPGPHKLADGKGRVTVVLDDVVHALGAPAGGAVAQGRSLQVIIRQQGLGKGEVIDAPALHGGPGLRAINHPVRVLLMVALVEELRVVVTHHRKLLHRLLGVFPGHVVAAQGGQGLAAGVVQPDQVADGFEHRAALFKVGVGVGNLIAQRPQDDAGVVAVTANPAGDVSLMPGVKIAGIVMLGLAQLPDIGKLADDHQPQLVRQIHLYLGRRVVSGADRVDTHALQSQKLPTDKVRVHGGADDGKLLVQADAVELGLFPVDEEAILRVKAQLAEPKAGVHRVTDLMVDKQGGAQGVQLRAVRRPGDDFARFQQLMAHLIGRALGFHFCGDLIDPLAVHKVGGDVNAVIDEVAGVFDVEGDLAVDASARIPPGAGKARVHLQQQGVVPVLLQKRCNVMLKGGEAILPFPGLVAVDIEGGVHVHAVKAQDGSLARL